MDHNEHEQLRELAERYGIASDYHDIWGHRHETPDQTRRAILEAMGVRVESPDALRRALADCADAAWRQVCDPVHVVRADEPAGCWSVRMPAQEQEDRGIVVSWDLRDESGTVRQRGRSEPGAAPAETRTVDGLRHVRVELPVPAGLPIGYYDMIIKGVSESRQVEGVLGDFNSREESRVASPDVYTRPEVLTYKGKKLRVPKVLLSGHQAKINEWKLQHRK